MKSRLPEGDPAFWVGARCSRVYVWLSESGAVLRRYTVVSTAGMKRLISSNGDPRPFSLQHHVLGLALVTEEPGATQAMQKVLPHVARVEQQAAILLPAAERRAREVLLRRRTRHDLHMKARRRERTLAAIRRNAVLLSEDDVLTAWREGVVASVHSL